MQLDVDVSPPALVWKFEAGNNQNTYFDDYGRPLILVTVVGAHCCTRFRHESADGRTLPPSALSPCFTTVLKIPIAWSPEATFF